MEEKRIRSDRRPGEGTSVADDQEQESRLARAFAFLRLVSDKDDPLSLKHAMARAKREADNFRQWQRSGAPIGGIAVRLADGEEMALVKRGSHMLAARCSVKELLP